MFPKISVCERCCCTRTADIAKPTEEESGRERAAERERERKAEPASAAAVTVKEGRGEEEEGADFDAADSPPPPPILVCDILLQKCENVEGLLYRGHRILYCDT